MARLPPVFTLVPPAVLGAYRMGRLRAGPTLLVFQCDDDGSITAMDFPDEIDASPALVAALDTPVVWIERERLYVTVANGTAVYVPVGPSSLPGCLRYGRLY